MKGTMPIKVIGHSYYLLLPTDFSRHLALHAGDLLTINIEGITRIKRNEEEAFTLVSEYKINERKIETLKPEEKPKESEEYEPDLP